MSNRLEQEFPPTKWMPPVGPAGAPPEVVWHYVEHGRQLRNQALRDDARTAGAAVVRAAARTIAFARRVIHGVTRRLVARDGWGSPAPGA
jgi:hypothetical protein